MAPLYTRRGDSGKTGLVSGRRVSKGHIRVQLYGLSDELNSLMGVAIAHALGKQFEQFREELQAEQNLLFELGSELAGLKSISSDGTILTADIENLEKNMDKMEQKVGRLRSFILPGGSAVSAHLHVARTVCRRLEREMASLLENKNRDDAGQLIVHKLSYIYINRLSDYLFMAARYGNFLNGVADITWSQRTAP